MNKELMRKINDQAGFAAIQGGDPDLTNFPNNRGVHGYKLQKDRTNGIEWQDPLETIQKHCRPKTSLADLIGKSIHEQKAEA